MKILINNLLSRFTKSVEQAAANSVYCAISPHLKGKGGLYFDDTEFRVPSMIAIDPLISKMLWEKTEKIISEIENQNRQFNRHT